MKSFRWEAYLQEKRGLIQKDRCVRVSRCDYSIIIMNAFQWNLERKSGWLTIQLNDCESYGKCPFNVRMETRWSFAIISNYLDQMRWRLSDSIDVCGALELETIQSKRRFLRSIRWNQISQSKLRLRAIENHCIADPCLDFKLCNLIQPIYPGNKLIKNAL